jgi:hypothetical protein
MGYNFSMSTEEVTQEIETCEHGIETGETDCEQCEELGEHEYLDEQGRLQATEAYWTSPKYLAYCAKHGLRPGRPSRI